MKNFNDRQKELYDFMNKEVGQVDPFYLNAKEKKVASEDLQSVVESVELQLTDLREISRSLNASIIEWSDKGYTQIAKDFYTNREGVGIKINILKWVLRKCETAIKQKK